MIYTKRFEWHYGPIFNYRIKWRSDKNSLDNNKYWQYEESWYVGVQINDDWKWFDTENFYYDGHKTKAIIILGVRFLKGYGWQSERII